MDESPRISTLPPESKSQDFEFLRSQGLAEIQALAAQTWTDHNLHDPGITLLEALCYATTDAGLRTGMDVPDLIASSTPYSLPEFFTAAEVLPAAPVTRADFRKILIAHPLVSNAWLFPFATKPLGRYSILLEFENDQLNNNSFTLVVTPAGLTQSYSVEIAFPHWNDEDIQVFQGQVTLLSVAFDGPPGNEWNNISGGLSYVTRAIITCQPLVGPVQVLEIWVVADILTEMEDAAVEAPLILQEIIAALQTLVAVPPDVPLLVQLNRRVTEAYEAMRVVRRSLEPYRNLCEDFVEFNAVRLQEIGINATLEVGSSVNIEELLAELYYRIHNMISPALQFESLASQLDTLKTAEAVFNGPLTDAGFLSDTRLVNNSILQAIHTSDILRIIYQLRSATGDDVVRREDTHARRIISVKNLKLSNYLNNRPIASGARDCLQLINSKNHVPRLSITKSRISVYRNGIRVFYDTAMMERLFYEKLGNDVQEIIAPESDLPVPTGTAYPVMDYYPVQNDLPTVYGVGEAGLPDHATSARQAQARQLKGYLFFFEQLLADSHAQLAQFNNFFSARPASGQSLYQQPLYNIPDIAPLFKGYNLLASNPAVAWQTFVQDTDNAYRHTLRTEAETQTQFLERRNAILDHLLAIQGEDMLDRTALLFRLAAQVPEGVSFPSVSALLDFQRTQRLSVLQELIWNKSSYYYDVPMLNARKGQAGNTLLWPDGIFLDVTAAGAIFNWTLRNNQGVPVFKQVVGAVSEQQAREHAQQAAMLATSNERYTVRIDGANRILELRSAASAVPIAESVAVYASDPLAQNAIVDIALMFRQWMVQYALSPYETRLYYMLGIPVKQRRVLTYALTDHVEIYDEVDVDPFIEKRFRLWSEAGFSGTILLESETNYPGPTDPDAMAAATAAVQQFVQTGAGILNYRIENIKPGTFRIALTLSDGTVIAQSPATFGSETDARAAVEKIAWLLSAEGLYVLENVALYQPDTGATVLSIGEAADPFSFQLTVVLPSGYERDFAGGDAAPGLPVLYRSGEFRKYVEQQVRKHCPAHILPRILWADRVTEGTPVDPAAPSFDAFEVAYRAWLAASSTDEVSDAVIAPLRENLVVVVNALYQEYYAS